MSSQKSYDVFFQDMVSFKPYNYQLKVGEKLLDGKNIILSVPTGAGKTWASIIPFLFALYNENKDFPKKMIYSLPLRTLTNSIYADVLEVLQKKNEFNDLISIHTGEFKDDKHFESDIIFSTIDQTLSNFLCFPLSLSRRQANINAGALVGSYLVFDEYHLLEQKLSMATTLGMLKILGKLCRFCIMTATLSKKYIDELQVAINADIISIDDFSEDIVKINSLKIPRGQKAKKILTVKDGIINAETIIKCHKCKTIVVCNRIEKAQRIYNDIVVSKQLCLDKSNVICLHSRFFNDDRKKKEKDIKRLFGKKSNESAILISTQVIEAGMDISCDVMHVEISPINSFLQRAGRCARWESEFGEIYVYDILELEEREQLLIKTDDEEELAQARSINNKYLPYDKKLCEATFRQLKNIRVLDKDISQKLVDDILAKHELKYYSLMVQNDFNRSKIQQSWENCEKNMYSQTIRDIQVIEVAIIDYLFEKEKKFIPFKYQTIGMYKWSFIKWVKEILSKQDFDLEGDVIFIAEKKSENTIIDFDANDIDDYYLKVVRTIETVKSYYDTVFVDKSVLRYTSDLGLELGFGANSSPLKPYDENEKEVVEYKKDNFCQHNEAIIGCYKQLFKPKLQFTFKKLSEYWGETIDWEKLIKVMICLHDYGKLNTAWQKPMRKLQELKAKQSQQFIFDPCEVLAHSDFNELTDKEIERQSGVKRKPPHAGIGGFVLAENAEKFIEVTDFDCLANSIATAILKHHGVETETYPDFDVTDEDYAQIERLLNGVNISIKRKARGGNLVDYLPTNMEEWVIYLFLVRILRLSDQKATMNFEEYLKQ